MKILSNNKWRVSCKYTFFKGCLAEWKIHPGLNVLIMSNVSITYCLINQISWRLVECTSEERRTRASLVSWWKTSNRRSAARLDWWADKRVLNLLLFLSIYSVFIISLKCFYYSFTVFLMCHYSIFYLCFYCIFICLRVFTVWLRCGYMLLPWLPCVAGVWRL